ncbi:MAG TPA: glycerol-3-phosphate acyltransferase [Bacillota bacterium]|nr:glycerol-3-phosphate acyltransferase [Bacillota bacterium]
MFLFISIFLGYVFGCIHGSQIIGKYKNIDIKNEGVKNAGASNTTILLGWKYGIIVGIIDIFKATFAVLAVLYLAEYFSIPQEAKTLYVYVTVLFVIIGHNFPITMKFQGGKGTASLVGSLLVIDWKIAVIGIGVLLLVSLLTDYLVIGVLFMYIAFFVSTFVLYDVIPEIIAGILLILSFLKHLENYRRIINKDERKISSMFKKKAS